MDQNTAIILAAFIGAGASVATNLVTGVALPYVTRTFNKKEKEKEEKKASMKQLYQTLLAAHDLCVQLAYDVRDVRKNDVDTDRRMKEISSTVLRIALLIGIDLPFLQDDLKKYEDSITLYWNKLGGYYAARDQLSSASGAFMEQGLLTAENEYQTSLKNILTKLQKLIKSDQ